MGAHYAHSPQRDRSTDLSRSKTREPVLNEELAQKRTNKNGLEPNPVCTKALSFQADSSIFHRNWLLLLNSSVSVFYGSILSMWCVLMDSFVGPFSHPKHTKTAWNWPSLCRKHSCFRQYSACPIGPMECYSWNSSVSSFMDPCRPIMWCVDGIWILLSSQTHKKPKTGPVCILESTALEIAGSFWINGQSWFLLLLTRSGHVLLWNVGNNVDKWLYSWVIGGIVLGVIELWVIKTILYLKMNLWGFPRCNIIFFLQ